MDRILTNRILAIPIFLMVMYGVFALTFSSAGAQASAFVDTVFNDRFSGMVGNMLVRAGAADWLISLVVNGIMAGVGAIMPFLPQILLMFFCLSILEDTGYIARVAFVLDKLFRKFGLSGKSCIPMLIGFGCSVPGIMAARTIESERDRKMTIILTPFMSCGARFPIYIAFIGAFFVSKRSIVLLSIYLLGIIVAVLSGVLLKNTKFKGEAVPFIMELPPYRWPTLKNTALHLWDKTKGFIVRAGTVIFAASIVVWFMQSYTFSLTAADQIADSMLGRIGAWISPVFAPLGFGKWQCSVALLTGVIAKESVVSTMGIIAGLGDGVTKTPAELASSLQSIYSPISAYAFMVFCLLYTPCVAAIGAMKKELRSWGSTLFALGYQTVAAWVMAFLVYRIGSIFIAS